MYYEHQYDRMAKLEEQGLAITNIVITLSVVAFTFGFDSRKVMTLVTGIALPFVMVVANVFAIVYIARSQSWMHTHRLRAKRALEVYALDLYELDRTTAAPHKDWWLGRVRIQALLHILLMVASFLPAVAYLRGLP
jgi:K+ transporter